MPVLEYAEAIQRPQYALWSQQIEERALEYASEPRAPLFGIPPKQEVLDPIERERVVALVESKVPFFQFAPLGSLISERHQPAITSSRRYTRPVGGQVTNPIPAAS